jgi:hypothetical protein
MKKLIFSIVFASSFLILSGQEFNVPADFSANKPDDYAKYEPDVIKSIDWFTNTPLNEQAAKRKEVYAFFLKWLTGTPRVSVGISEKIVTFIKPNGDLMFIFMGGWTKYALESKDYKNVFMGNLKGVESVIAFYQKNKAFLKKDKNVEKYIKMKENGTLEGYIKTNSESK